MRGLDEIRSEEAEVEIEEPLSREAALDDSLPYDAVIVGAGIQGILLLAEAVKHGYKRVIIVEKKPCIGGLWAELPAWQTLQNDTGDFCLNGFYTQRKTWHAGDVCHMLEEYVRVSGIRAYVRLQQELVDQSWDKSRGEDGMWTLKVKETRGGHGGRQGGRGGLRSLSGGRRTVTRTYQTPMLILCTGKHCTPHVPAIPTDGSVPLIHSSKVHDWQALKGKNVAVVGAGASALDMAINALKANEGQPASVKLHWLLRQPKHFGGFDYADLLLLTIFQLIFGMHANGLINLVMNLLIYARFWWMGLPHWLPRQKLDLTKQQYVPGRAYLLRNHARIDRRVGVEIVEVKNRVLRLSDGSVLEGVDAVLLGTGYDTPKHNPNLGLRGEGELLSACMVSGEKLGHLFLFGEDLLDSTGATPLTSHLCSRHFWHTASKTGGSKGFKELAAISARAHTKIIIPRGRNVNHLDMLLMSSYTVPRVYPTLRWRGRMLLTHLYYRLRYGTRVFYADRVLGLNMSLDEPRPTSAPALAPAISPTAQTSAGMKLRHNGLRASASGSAKALEEAVCGKSTAQLFSPRVAAGAI